MGYLRRLDDNADIQAFPGALFEIVNDVPAPQCSEAKIESETGQTFAIANILQEFNKFAGYDLTGKVAHITASVGGNIGDFGITGNDVSIANLDGDPGNGNPVTYYISDGGGLILTRNAKSFAEYIHEAGYAYTIKGGKLYTNMPSGQLKNACTILFDPIT